MREWFESIGGLEPDTKAKLIATAIILIVLFFIRRWTGRLLVGKIKDPKALYTWKESITYISYGIAIILLIAFWFEKFESVGTILGLFSAGLAVALKDPLVNLAGWLFIVIRRPLQVGDRIQIGEFKGDVIDIRIFQFTLNEIGNWVEADQSTGRIIHIPNGKVFTEMQANYSRGFKFIWNEVKVLITFESNWEKAKHVLQEIANENTKNLSESAEERLKVAAQKFMIFYNKLTPFVYTSVKDSGVLLTIRYLCNPRQRRGSEHLLWEKILAEFDKHQDIEFAYPTQRFYRLNEEKDKP